MTQTMTSAGADDNAELCGTRHIQVNILQV